MVFSPNCVLLTCPLSGRGEELEGEVAGGEHEGQPVLPLPQVGGGPVPARPAHQAGPVGRPPARWLQQLLGTPRGGRGQQAQRALLQQHPTQHVHCYLLCDEMFDHFSLFDETLRLIELCNSVISHRQQNPPSGGCRGWGVDGRWNFIIIKKVKI